MQASRTSTHGYTVAESIYKSLSHISFVSPEVNTAEFCYGTTMRHCDIFDEEDVGLFSKSLRYVRIPRCFGQVLCTYPMGVLPWNICKVLAEIFDVAKPSTWNCICDTVRTVGWIELRGWPGNRLRSDHQNSFRLTSMHREYESRRNEGDN